MIISDIKPEEYNEYYARYLAKSDGTLTLLQAFELGLKDVLTFFSEVPAEKLNHRYESDKWSVKEVLQHLIDTERIFFYRAFRIARGDTTPLAGFDQTGYIEHANVASKTMNQLCAEFEVGRRVSISLINSLSSEDLIRVGTASDHAISARAAAAIIPGHDIWHMEIVAERYL